MKIESISSFFKDKDDRLVIIQAPNFYLIAWAILTIISKFTNEKISGGIYAAAKVFLLTWAYFELTKGDSVFRRALGLIVMILTSFGIIRSFL